MKEQCKQCGELYDELSSHECNQDYFSIYNFAKLHGVDLDKGGKSDLKINDIVTLNPDNAASLFDYRNVAKTPWSENYRQIYENNIKGKIITLNEIKSHYCWGKYAYIEWENGSKSELIEVSWLKKYE